MFIVIISETSSYQKRHHIRNVIISETSILYVYFVHQFCTKILYLNFEGTFLRSFFDVICFLLTWFWTSILDISFERQFWTWVLDVNFVRKFMTNERSGNWSCDLRANERPKKTHGEWTDTQTLWLYNWPSPERRVSENCATVMSQSVLYPIYNIHINYRFPCPTFPREPSISLHSWPPPLLREWGHHYFSEIYHQC